MWAFAESGFILMLYRYVFMYIPDTVPRKDAFGIPRFIFPYAILARGAGTYTSGLKPPLNARYANTECHLTATPQCNIKSSQNKLISRDNRKLVRTPEKSIQLMSCIIDFFTPCNGYVLDPYAGTMPLELAGNRTKRCLYCTKLLLQNCAGANFSSVHRSLIFCRNRVQKSQYQSENERKLSCKH